MAYQTHDIIGASELMSRSGTNGIIIHQPQVGAGLDGVKEWLDKRSVANMYLVAGAAIAGIAYYGYTQRWF